MLFIVTDPEYIIAELIRSSVTVQTPLTVGHLGRRQSQYTPTGSIGNTDIRICLLAIVYLPWNSSHAVLTNN